MYLINFAFLDFDALLLDPEKIFVSMTKYWLLKHSQVSRFDLLFCFDSLILLFCITLFYLIVCEYQFVRDIDIVV